MKNLFEQLQGKRPQLIVKGQLWAWDDIEKRVYQKVQSFQSLGLKKGDIVAASGSKSWLAISWLACLLGGFIFCPVPPSIKNLAPPSNPSLSDSNSRLLLWFHEDSDPLITSHLFKEWDFLSKLNHPCALLKTSETSDGMGRWIALENDRVQKQIQAHAVLLQVKASANRMQTLPLYHVFGLILDLTMGLSLGQTIQLLESPQLLSRSWIELAQTKNWDMALTPRLLHLLHCFYPKSRSLGQLHLGGARVSAKLLHHAHELFHSSIEGYGMTECGPGVLLDGKPVDCKVRLDPISSLEDSLGLLEVKSESMGIWESDHPYEGHRWYPTRDLARWHEGRYQILGRLDRSIKHLDGRWIWLDQLESEWETLLGLYALRIEMKTNGCLQLTLLEEDAKHIPRLEKLGLKFFDLPIEWVITPLERVIFTRDKMIFGSKRLMQGPFQSSGKSAGKKFQENKGKAYKKKAVAMNLANVTSQS